MGLFNSIRLGSSAAGDYEIERSLRFNDNDTAYLSRNFGTGGNRKKWTFSAWIKRANLGGSAGEMRIFGGSTNASHIFFTTNDALTWDVAAPGSSASANLTTSQLFRDPSAWYHIVCALDTDESTADNRMRIYINGSEITSFGTRTNPSSGYAANAINADAFADGDRSLHTIGYRTSVQGSAGMEFDGYMAEINFIDGQQYDPSYFGETNAITGQWNPKKYVGSYGTTGFYLPLSDNSGTTATTLGKDSSGNGNNFTPNNFATTDVVKDSPTNNFCTLNPLDKGSITLSEGNLKATYAAAHETAMATFGMASGKWYWEVYNGTSSSDGTLAGLGSNAGGILNSHVGSTATSWGYENAGLIWNNSNGTGSNAALSNGDIFGIAYDADAGTIKFYKNNTLQSSSFSSVTANNYMPQVSLYHSGSFVVANFGQDSSFAGNKTAQGNADGSGQGDFYYAPPSGYKALCSANIPDPTIKLPAQHFNTLLYTGNDSSDRDITGVGFQPDLLWIKNRSQADFHCLQDSVRGANKILYANDTDNEQTDNANGHVNSFLADGFNVDAGASGNVNENNENYVAWNWNAGGTTVTNTDGTISAQVRASATAGISIVTYSGSGSNDDSVGHGLGVTPDAVLIRKRNGGANWVFESPHTHNGRGMYLNLSDGSGSSGTDTTSRSSSLVTFDNSSDTNRRVNHSGDNYVMYCFSNVSQYAKIGKYTGNNSTDGTFVFTGFQPAYLVIKKTNGTANWIQWDNARMTHNVMETVFELDESGAESGSSNTAVDFLSNGFKFRNNFTKVNGNGDTYIYLAFAESPFKYSRAR